MIPDFKTYIRESVWSDIHKRSNGDKMRKEDKFGNIDELEEVDLDGLVNWSDRDFELDGQYLFSYSEVKDIMENIDIGEWRLPTSEDVTLLEKCSIKEYPDSLRLKKKNTEIFFKKRGYIHFTEPDNIDEANCFFGWTSDEYSTKSMNVFAVDKKHGIDYLVVSKRNKFCIRLVKNRYPNM